MSVSSFPGGKRKPEPVAPTPASTPAPAPQPEPDHARARHRLEGAAAGLIVGLALAFATLHVAGAVLTARTEQGVVLGATVTAGERANDEIARDLERMR